VTDAFKRIEQKLGQQPGTILGPDGRPVDLEPVIEDRSLTYAKDGESYVVKPGELAMRAARLQRDGMSLKQIRAELDLIPSGPMRPTDAQLQAWLNIGHNLLDRAIKAGTEPAESKRVLRYLEKDEGGDDDA